MRGTTASTFTNGDYWIAFRPNQIKSAVGNNGDFDPNNDNILFSRSVGDAPRKKRSACNPPSKARR